MLTEILLLTLVFMIFFWVLSLLKIYQLPLRFHLHHAYLGIAFVALYFLLEYKVLFVFGAALFVSDCIDHLFFINLRKQINQKITSFFQL